MAIVQVHNLNFWFVNSWWSKKRLFTINFSKSQQVNLAMTTPEELAYATYRQHVDYWLARGDKTSYGNYADSAWNKAVKRCQMTAITFRYEPVRKGQLQKCIFITPEEKVAMKILERYWQFYVKKQLQFHSLL